MFYFIFLSAMAFAKGDQNACSIALTNNGITLPVVEVEFEKKNLDVFASDGATRIIDWKRLFGRKIQVVWRADGKTISTSQQGVFSRAGLIEKYPDLTNSVNQIIHDFSNLRSKIEKSFSYRFIRPILKVTGFQARCKIAERCLPGEFGKLVLRMPTETWESDQLSSWSQNKSFYGRLFLIRVDSILSALGKQLNKLTYDYNSLPRPLLRVYFVHNHPGLMDPLSVADLSAQDLMADLLSRNHDMFDFELIIVALSHLNEPGDVAFVRKVSRIRSEDGSTSTWTADGESRSYEAAGRSRLRPKLNPPRRRLRQ